MATRNTAGTRTAVSGLNLAGCLRFNGIGSVVTIPDSANYSWVTTSKLSISFWFNPERLTGFPTEEGTGGDRYVGLLCKAGSGTNEWEFRMYSQDNTVGRANRISFYTYTAAGGLGDGVAVQDDLVAGQWIHMVATVDASQVMRLYKDSVQRDQFTSSMVMTDTTSTVKIGANQSNSVSITSYFMGMIDDVQIYNRVLDANEIRQIYLTGRCGATGLVGWWKLDDAAGGTAVDSSTVANNGVVTQSDWRVHAIQGRQPVDPPGDNAYISSSVTAASFPQRRWDARNEGTNVIKFNGTSDLATVATYIIPPNLHTIAFWVKFNKLVSNDRVFDQQDAGPQNGVTAALTVSAGSQTLGFTIRNGASNVTNVSSGQLIAGVWYHVIETNDQVSGQKLYVNGVQQASHAIGLGANPAATLTVGRRAGSASNFFSGDLREFLVYNRVLSLAEIQNLFFSGLVPTSGLDLAYSFDSTANDGSGNERNLTLTGTSYVADPPRKTRANI